MNDAINYLIQARERYWQERRDPVRLRCGISEAGASCSRFIWYAIRACAQEEMEATKLKFLQGGHEAEQASLNEIAEVIHLIKPENGHQHSVKIEKTHNHLNGSCDGIAHADGKYTLIEHKAVGDKGFKDIVKNGLQSRPTYIAQANLYIYGLNQADFIKKYHFLNGEAGKKNLANDGYPNKITQTLFIILNRNTSETYYEVMAHDEEQAKKLIDRFLIVLKSPTPPAKITENQMWFECKWCKYWSICHGQEIPLTNCRTCMHSFPAKEAGWKCGKFNKLLTEDEQRQACNEHLFIPSLIKAAVTNQTEQFISYNKDGKVFKNITASAPQEPYAFTSRELSTKGSMKVVTDPFIAELKEEFPMRLID